MKLSRRHLLGTAAAGSALAALPAASARAQSPLKVGFVYVGPKGDNGWSFRHDVARLAVEEALGDKVETRYVENVPEGPDAERVIRQLAATGQGLIYTTSFGFMNPTLKVAKQFPDVKFEHATGYVTTPNVAVYNARFYEGRSVIGTMAAMMSKKGVAGYIGSVPIPEVVMGIDAFTLAAQKVNPDFRTVVVWVNSWHDPGKEADAAKALFDQGVDIIAQHTDSAAPLQVAEQRGLYGFGQAADQSAFAPEGQLTAIVDNWGPYYIKRTQEVIDGTWETHDVWYGLKEGMVSLAPYGPAVPPDVAAAADKVKAGIIDGSYQPFGGPIMDQSGAKRVAEGETIPDGDLLKLDWYVKGVQA
ncbi:MAG: BMP family ABC transporter substrate-binding protein [Geminicoccaceae bacterium]|nr:BMP family ABC transporter substrate-binding protein [Geminicoccaceae bacterium]